MKVALILVLLSCISCGTSEKKHPASDPSWQPAWTITITKSHWIEIQDSYRQTEACIQDSDGEIIGYALLDYPSLEPGIWYALDKDEHTIARYPSKILAKRAVEKHVGGCPGFTKVE